jgi:hypothetical protein
MEMKKLWLFIGVSFIAGFIWGGVFKDILPKQYLDPEMPTGEYKRMATIDVIQNDDDIWIVEHKTGHLIFEYNRFKEVDKEAFGEYEDFLVEMLKRK